MTCIFSFILDRDIHLIAINFRWAGPSTIERKAPMPNVELIEAMAPLILAIDIGSSSVRSLLYDAAGRQINGSECQLGHVLKTDTDGAAEAVPTELLAHVVACVDSTVAFARARQTDFGAVAISSFWHSVMGIDTDGHPTTPVFTWADKRAGVEVERLTEEFPVEVAVGATGCRIHSSYWPAKLRWLRHERSVEFLRTTSWLSFADFLALKLTGRALTSISMASGTGLLAIDDLIWHAPMVEEAGISMAQLPAIIDRDQRLPAPLPAFQARWPELANVPWFPAIGDGAAANVGAGCVGADRIALTVGTSGAMRMIVRADERIPGSPPGQLWVYRLDRERCVIGGALSNGGNVTSWLADRFAGGDFTALAEDAAGIGPDQHGMTVLPFLAGERSPSWDDKATGVFAGLTLATTPAEIYRATLEAAAYRFAAIYDDLGKVVRRNHEIHANGAAVLNSPLWLQIMSDVLGHPIAALDAEAEASARGAAICALESIGALPSLRPAESDVIRRYVPDESTRIAYCEGRARQRRLEQAMQALQAN